MASQTIASSVTTTNVRANASVRVGPRGVYKCRATQLTPAWDRLIPGEPVSLDIEFQTFKHPSWEKWRHRVGRVAIVNSKGETVLDVYAAYPKEEGIDKDVPPKRFMISHQDLKFCNGAVPAHKVEKWVKQIISGRTVILHGGTHDLTAFVIETGVYANSNVVDTQMVYCSLQSDGTPGLRTTAAAILGESIQEVEHSPVEDAQTALKLWYQKHTFDRDAELAKIRLEGSNQSSRMKNRARPNKGGNHQAVANASEFPPLVAVNLKR